MSREGEFLIYCVEQYKSAKKMTGFQVSELFSKYDIWDYIYSCFEALHTTGANYIINDIDLFFTRPYDLTPEENAEKNRQEAKALENELQLS